MGLTLSALRAKAHKRKLSTREISLSESLAMSNESSKENEISPSSIEKYPTTNFCFDPENPFYETCGIRISLRGSVLSTENIIIHSLPEAFGHFDALRCEEIDCDAVIVIGKKRIKVHKVLLIERIPYFKNLLIHNWRDSTSSEYSISEVDCSSMEYILDYAYTGNLFISHKNVQDMMFSANYLGMDVVMYECAEFMRRRIRFDDLIPLLQFMRSIQFSRIDHLLLRFLDTNFVPISLSDEFLELSIDELSNILKRNSLHVDNEMQVFEAVDRWISVEETRVQFGPRLLKLIRCSLLSPSLLNEIVETKKWIKDNVECIDIVRQAQNNAVLNSSNITERVCYDAYKLIFSTGIQERPVDLLYELYDPLQNKWTMGIFYNCPHIHFDCVAIANKIVFIGYERENGEGPILTLNTQTNQWNEVTYTGRTGVETFIEMGVIDGRIFVVGDNVDDYTIFESIDPFDPSPVWARLANINIPISSAATCVADGKFYLIGGRICGRNGRRLSEGQVYDPNTNIWSPIAPMKTARSSCAATVLNGEIYVCGGYWNASCKDVEKYCPMTNRWTTLKSMNIARGEPGIITSCGMIFALGGWCQVNDEYGPHNEWLKCVERYDPERDCWEMMKSMSDYHDGVNIGCTLAVPASFPTPLFNLPEGSFMGDI